MEKLHRYLASKDSLQFKFTGELLTEVDGRHTSGLTPEMKFYGRGTAIKQTIYIGTGTLYYVSDGHHEKVEVTAYLVEKPENRKQKQLAGLDISRTPRGSAYFTAPYR
jgi:hypothetical protein